MTFFERINSMAVAEALLAYLDKGIAVFPLRPDDPKVPAVRWKPYQTTTPTIYEGRQWIAKWGPELVLALATGAHNNLYALDTDTEAAERWVRENAPPTPLRQKTRKGWHHFYRPGSVKFTIGVNIGPDHLRPGPGGSTGLDYRGEAGYLVAAPSVVHDHRYQWEFDASAGKLPTLDVLGQGFFRSSGTKTAQRGRTAPHGGTNAAGGPELAYTSSGLVAIGCRDFYLRDLVMGIIATHVRENDALPDVRHVAEVAWDLFQQRCDTSDDVPKFEHCLQKAEYAIRRVADGAIVIADDDGFPIA